jgi:hypothetical protein
MAMKKGQTITMAKIKRTDNNNGHKKRTDNNNGHKKRPLSLSVLFIFAIVIVCPFLLWQLLLSVLFLMAIDRQ